MHENRVGKKFFTLFNFSFFWFNGAQGEVQELNCRKTTPGMVFISRPAGRTGKLFINFIFYLTLKWCRGRSHIGDLSYWLLITYCIRFLNIPPKVPPYIQCFEWSEYQIKKAPGSKENPSTLPLLPCHDINQSCGEGWGMAGVSGGV